MVETGPGEDALYDSHQPHMIGIFSVRAFATHEFANDFVAVEPADQRQHGEESEHDSGDAEMEADEQQCASRQYAHQSDIRRLSASRLWQLCVPFQRFESPAE